MDDREQRYYHSLYEIAAIINSASTSDSLLRSVVENVALVLEAKGCSIMLRTPDKKLLLHTASFGLSDCYIQKGPVFADMSIAAALRGQPVAVLNAGSDDRIQYQKQASEEGIASILSVPVMLRERVIGVMRVYTSEPYYFTETDIYFVGAVANLGAIALENARLYDSAQKDYEALSLYLAEWREALGHEWLGEETELSLKEN